MGKWLAALKEYEIARNQNRQNPQNLLHRDSKGLVGSPSEGPGNSPGPPPEGAGEVLSVLSVPVSQEFDVFLPDPDDLRARFEERAGILEYDHGYSRTDAERQAELEIYGD